MLFPTIPPLSASHSQQAQRLWDTRTKPVGSLGRLETVTAALCAMQARVPPLSERKQVLLFAGDHAITEEGVSAYPAEVTAQMVANYCRGGAAINTLARLADATLEVVDVGVFVPLPQSDLSHLALNRKVRAGARNFAHGEALTDAELEQAVVVGIERANGAADSGVHLLALGEMGIGNTASAAALLSLLTGLSAQETVGRGAGATEEQLAHKRAVIAWAVERHRHGLRQNRREAAWDALRCVAGLEIAALVGAMIGAAARRVPIVVDGFIGTVAALAAVRLLPEVRGYLVFAHRSAEAGHGHALTALEASPLLDLEMRLGEASGAVLALPLLEAGVCLLRDMASFATAGVSEKV